MEWLRFVFALLFLFGAQDVTYVTPVERGVQASMRIEVMTEGQWQKIGSGTAIANRGMFGSGPRYAIATANHVASYLETGKLRACSVVSNDCVELSSYTHPPTSRMDVPSDWALLMVEELPEGSRVAKVSTDVSIGENIYIIGHPWGEFSVKHGTISSIEYRGKSKYYTADSYAAGGSSGGAVIDSAGRLIGIVSAVPVRNMPPLGLPAAGLNEVYVVPVDNLPL